MHQVLSVLFSGCVTTGPAQITYILLFPCGQHRTYIFYSLNSGYLLMLIDTLLCSMAEEAAGIVICCVPSTAIVFKSIRGSQASWVLSTAKRLTGSSRSGGSTQRKGVENDGNSIYLHLASHSSHQDWNDIEAETHSLQHMNIGNDGATK